MRRLPANVLLKNVQTYATFCTGTCSDSPGPSSLRRTGTSVGASIPKRTLPPRTSSTVMVINPPSIKICCFNPRVSTNISSLHAKDNAQDEYHLLVLNPYSKSWGKSQDLPVLLFVFLVIRYHAGNTLLKPHRWLPVRYLLNLRSISNVVARLVFFVTFWPRNILFHSAANLC